MLDIREALKKLREANKVEGIVNPYTGDKAAGFEAALSTIAQALFGEGPLGPFQKKLTDKLDPRMKPLPIPLRKPLDTLNPKELEDLLNRVKAARDKANDVIDDAGNRISPKKAEEISDTLDDLEQQAEEAKTESDANKIKARLKTIADFWEGEAGEQHRKSLERDIADRRDYKELNRSLRRARVNAKYRNYSYRPMSIGAIVNNIVRTIKTQVQPYRDSSWDVYNPRSDDMGYVMPGRYNAEKRTKPRVVFYFDVSGSWCRDKVKIDMGHRIEEALKVLDHQNKIELSCYYFGTTVHDYATRKDQGNSDAPIPHAIKLLEAGELDNVIIMTDDNPSSDQKLQVPGYAWLLFYDTVSESLATNVSGKKGTSIVMIEH